MKKRERERAFTQAAAVRAWPASLRKKKISRNYEKTGTGNAFLLERIID
tara:strand:- start:1080 stop:1226 length:147 start_codon:yes stop_codon:yes gene_type:complete